MVGRLKSYTVYAALVAMFSVLMSVDSQISLIALRAADQATKENKNKKIDVFKILIANEDQTQEGIERAYTLAGVIIDRSRKVKRNRTTAEVKVASEMPNRKNSSQPFDVILLVRPSEVKNGTILMFTSDPVDSCRPFLRTFLMKTLSAKRIGKAYKGAKLKPAEYLTRDLQNDGWLGSCTG